MSLYDKESESNLQSALDSVFHQTLPPTEVILVFDGPIRKELSTLVETYSRRYNLKVVPLKKNMGLGIALNTGLAECSHDLVARMDSDDICYHDRFEKQVEFMLANPQVCLLGTSIQEFNTIPGDLNRFRVMPVDYASVLKFAIYRSPVNHPSVMFRKAAIEASGSYQHMPLFEDYYLFIVLLTKGYIIENLSMPLLHYRVGNDMIGRRHGYSYMVKELAYFKAARAIGFLNNTTFLKSIIYKLPLRLLPKRLLYMIYRIFLR